MRDTNLVLAISDFSATDPACWSATAHRSRTFVPPARASLSVRTVAGHVASIATHSADDVGCVILPFRAVVLAVANLSTILAGLVLVVSQSPVEGSKLTELVTLQFVLAFGDR